MASSAESRLQQKIDRLRKADERMQKATLEMNHARILLLAAADEVEDAMKTEKEKE